MNKSKTKKLALLTTVTILLLGFIPAVQAKSTILPLDRWWEDNMWWYENNPHLGGFIDPDSSLVVRPHTIGGELIIPPPPPDPEDPPDPPYWQWYYAPIWGCDYSGHIKIRELNGEDGYDVMVTVIRKCKDAPFILIDWNNFPIPIFYGIMKYVSFYEFKIDLDLYPFQDGDGWDLPIWWMPIFGGWETDDPRDIGLLAVSSHFVAQGEGEFLSSWNGWDTGDTANVKVNQIGLVKFVEEDGWSEHPGEFGHPNYYPPGGGYIYGELWPVEYIRVY